ncbi:MAG: efflux RND transporter periplasmic adaptor subunit [Holosporaceae bacterium]|jgi:membrane fusion protein (multidrug efflux system)|nr:efflux RND transporter periplasmic adaptor subunit [Holosporaceae bacterium]
MVNNSLKKKQIMLYGGIGAAILLFCWMIYKIGNGKENKLTFTPPAVTVCIATFGPVVKYINAIGTLRPFNSVVIKTEVNAKIKNIYFSEGAIVKENDLLIELDDSTARAQLTEAEALYRRAKVEFDPVEKLADKGVATRVSKDKMKAEMEKCAANVNSYKTLVDKHKIHAPFGGIIGLYEISKGQFVSSGNELLKIVDCHPLKVDFKVAEVDVGNVYVGQEVQIMIGGDKTQVFDAKITAIDPESDKITHSFDVRAVLDIPEEMAVSSQILKPGRFVSVKIAVDGDQRGILIPESSLEKIGDEDLVYRVTEGIAIRTIVTVGMRRDGNVEIITGINEGDIVITSGQASVLDGKEVSIKNNSSTADVVTAVKKLYENRNAPPKNKSKNGK